MAVVRFLCVIGTIAVLIVAAHESHAQTSETSDLYRRLKVSLGYHFSSGQYGTSDGTEISYVPLITRADLGNWSFEVTIPYIRISGPPTALGSGQRTIGGEQDGLGDILSRGSYTILSRADWMPFIELIGRVKYPTASRSRGLGTGEFDYGFETELSWAIDRIVPFIGGGYRILNSPPDNPLHDVWLASAGAMYRTIDPLWLGLLVDYRTAASASSGERLELVPFASWRVAQHWSVDPYVSAGLKSGSPDFGVGLQLGYIF